MFMRSAGGGILFLVACLCSPWFVAHAQVTGGRARLDFLQLPAQARSTALGSNHITAQGNDPALFLQNPALLDSAKINNVSLNLMPYLADTKFVNMGYANRIRKTGGIWAIGLQYL